MNKSKEDVNSETQLKTTKTPEKATLHLFCYKI